MKHCPRCMRTYTDENLNFCLEDGELLTNASSAGSRPYDDSPPTVMFDEVRRTNPTNWPDNPPPAASAAPPQPWEYNAPAAQGGAFAMPVSPNQTLAIVSLGLGIASLTIGWCCWLGLILGPAGLITGFIALSQIKRDPLKYSGRGLAIGGMATSGVALALYLLMMLIWGLAALSGGMR